MDIQALLERVRQRPGMYLRAQTFDVAVAFIDGLNLATDGSLLVGLREWLVVLVRGSNSLGWPALVLEALAARGRDDGEAARFAGLFDLLDEFFQARHASEGLRRIYLRYDDWLSTQPWYVPGSPHWVDRAGGAASTGKHGNRT